MTNEFEQVVKRALDTFIAVVVKAAEDAAIDAIQTAFVQVVAQRRHGETPSRNDERRSQDRAHRRTPANSDVAAVLDRIVAGIRENPGRHIGELSQFLELSASTLRRHLRKLANDGAIRMETRPDTRFGGQRIRMFFPVEQTHGAGAERSTASVETTA